ncbi:sigma-54-dependent transcriptional regulator [Magnetococcales bacterium HHB-1]
METHTILVVDDEEAIRTSLRGILEDEDYRVVEAASGEEALTTLAENRVSAVLLDIWMEGIDGIETLRRIKKPNRRQAQDSDAPAQDVPVIMMSGHGTIDTAVSATKIGAYDFLEKPLSLDRVLLLLERAIRAFDLALENESLKARMGTSDTMIGSSPAMQNLQEQIFRAAPTDGWVLITGESGSGKEVAARRLHQLSNRNQGPFVAVNSAAIPETLIESELFGHEKGAFPGVAAAKIGRFEQGNGGTLFLDEIGDMSTSTQAKILRVLQEQRFERIGGNQQIEVDVRVIAASSRDLRQEAQEGRFRKALYYRLNVIPITIPPLRNRRQDIVQLINYFAKLNNNLPQREFSREVIDKMVQYSWPGNVRELKNLVERLLIMAPGPVVHLEDLPESISKMAPSFSAVEENEKARFKHNKLREARESFERDFLRMQLQRHNGNISRTAETVGMERSALHRKLKLLGLLDGGKGR